MRSGFLLLILTTALSSKAQRRINASLKRELDSIYTVDQKYRLLMDVSGKAADSLAAVFHTTTGQLQMTLWNIQSAIDSSNLAHIESIIDRYGYPGKSLVDTPANETAYYVIQHSTKIDTYLPLIKASAEKDELPYRLYATMLDRSLMYAGKEQLYGTQGQFFGTIDPKTGQPVMHKIIWPIGDPTNVNARRKAAGFSTTVEENARRLDIEYHVLSLEEVAKMKSGK
jgi:hypothetical protein